jgi:hypothetical protein
VTLDTQSTWLTHIDQERSDRETGSSGTSRKQETQSVHQECHPEHTTGVRTVAGGNESWLLVATRTQSYISTSVRLRRTINPVIQYMCLLQLSFHNNLSYSNPQAIKMSHRSLIGGKQAMKARFLGTVVKQNIKSEK